MLDQVFNWVAAHSLVTMLSAGTIFTFLWLLQFRERLRLNAFAALVLSIIHVAIGMVTVMSFAVLENIGDPNAFGKLSLFGAVFFMPLAYWGGAKLTKRKISTVFDVFVICLIFTLMCARINCLFSGCCTGLPLPFAGMEHLRWPTRETEIVFYIVLLLLLAPKVYKGKSQGELYPIYMISYGIFRLIIETFRVPSMGAGSIIHLSHFWALICLCIGASLYFELHKTKRR